jgi:hypothetical protein
MRLYDVLHGTVYDLTGFNTVYKTETLSNCKLQTRHLVREGTPHKQIRNCLKIIKKRIEIGRRS